MLVEGLARAFLPADIQKIDAGQEPLKVGDRVRSRRFGGWLRVHRIKAQVPQYVLPDGCACYRNELKLTWRDA